MINKPLKLLIFGAHPDDAEYHAGGMASIYRELGHTVKMVSLTNGQAGHHERSPEQLALIRREEAAEAGRVIGAEYVTWEILEQVPDDDRERLVWLRQWYRKHVLPRAERFRGDLIAAFGPQRGRQIEFCEVYEISDYAAAASLARREQLFPGAVCRSPEGNPAATPAQLEGDIP